MHSPKAKKCSKKIEENKSLIPIHGLKVFNI